MVNRGHPPSAFSFWNIYILINSALVYAKWHFVNTMLSSLQKVAVSCTRNDNFQNAPSSRLRRTHVFFVNCRLVYANHPLLQTHGRHSSSSQLWRTLTSKAKRWNTTKTCAMSAAKCKCIFTWPNLKSHRFCHGAFRLRETIGFL